jgi:hypothetical protein
MTMLVWLGCNVSEKAILDEMEGWVRSQCGETKDYELFPRDSRSH